MRNDSPFTTHEHDAIALNRNVVPVPECRVNPALKDGKVIDVVDVPILSCASAWLRCQEEAERWISDCDGSVMKRRPDLINARINAAYAWLWMSDHRFQWAGLAAFASKQVGCGLLHSSEMIRIGSATAAGPVDWAAGKGAAYMNQQLAIGNRTLFLDIYPLHRFYTLRGIKGLRECLGERQLIRDKVKWEVKDVLPFGLSFKEINAGFEAIERGDIMESVRQLARHEQINVLQAIIYNNPTTRALLDGNQAAWVIGIPSGLYEEIQLTLSAQCKPKRTLTTMLKKSLSVALWNPDDRMKFVYQAAEDFDKVLRQYPHEVEASIKHIYLGHGVR
jgi:hypothetical protein